MQSARVVVLIVAVACACDPGQASSVATKQSRPRHTLLNLVRAASGLAGSYPENQSSPRNQLSTQNNLLYPRSLALTHDFPVRLSDESSVLKDKLDDVSPRVTQVDVSHRDNPSIPQYASQPMSWSKRSDEAPQADGQGEVLGSIQHVGSSLSANFLRNARATTRPYDVPQIECPPADDQMERFPCPSPDRMGRYRCIDDHVLCDGFIDCPDGEDEDRQQCMFYKTTKAHLDVIADAIIRFIRGRK